MTSEIRRLIGSKSPISRI